MFKHTLNLLSKTEKQFFLFIFFVLISLSVFFPTLYAHAFWDDWIFIFRNDHFYQQSFLSYFPGGAESRSWPIFYSLMKLFLKIFGDNFFYYHLVSLICHGINGFILWKIFSKLKIQYAFWLALLYIVHPLQVFNVGWIIQFKTVLSVFFFLSTIFYLIKFFQDEKYRFLFFAFCLFSLSLLTKSTTVGLIFTIPFFYTKFKNKFGLRKIFWISLPFLLLTLYAVIRTIWSYHFAEIFPQLTSHYGKTQFEKGFETNFYTQGTFVERIVLTVKILGHYLAYLVFPASNPIFQKKIVTTFTSLEFLLLFSVIVFIVQLGRNIFESEKLILKASFVFFLISLIPFCGFFWIPIFAYSNLVPYWLSVPVLGLLPLLPRYIKNRKIFIFMALSFSLISFVHSTNLTSTDQIFLDSIEHSPLEKIYYVALIEQYVYSAECDNAKKTYDKLMTISVNKEDALLTKINRCFQIARSYSTK